ncbi:MAG: hypothetical protein E7645_00900 [Ruminococcaceae bacterium]|nr:hypothetical protein [Oscillospiraceae bacterium]
MAKVQTNVAHRHVRTLTLDEFRGVDFTSSVLDVDKRRAVSMKNLLPKAGRNVKRPGWKQVHRLGGRIHGMWTFTRGNTEELIVHAGSGLYEVYEEDGVSKSRAVQGRTDLLGDGVSEVFFYGGRMYLTGHKAYLVYGSWDGGETYELREVADGEDTYVPTTTIGINATGETDEEGNAKDSRVSWDPVNRLSSKRKNRMMGKNAETATWYLDSAVDWTNNNQNSDVVVEVDVRIGVKVVTYRLESSPHLEGVTFENDLVFTGDMLPEGMNKGSVGGKVFGGSDDRTTIVLNFKTAPPREGEDNITVTFTKHVVGHAESIGACRFGVLYGAGGNADRLFLAGNPDTPEMEYYSYWRDPTYFPDVYYNRVGTSYSAVTGFARVSDGVLAVFKEGDRQEPTIYYHTANEEIIYNDDKKLERVDFILTTQAGNIGEAIVSRRASVDFFGDPLILSENGVFGIVMRQNLMTEDRYAAERSRNVREKLRGMDKSRAVGVVFENKYWLFVGGGCFVADNGYTFRPKEASSGYQYEWWYLEGIPAASATVMGDHLWFGTEDGQVSRFRSDDENNECRFTDETFRYFAPWSSPGVSQDVESMTVSADDFSKIVVSEVFISKLGNASMDTLVLSSETYARYLNADEVTVEGGRIFLKDPNRIRDIRAGTVVYSDELGGVGVTPRTPLVITDIDRAEGSFMLTFESGSAILTETSARLVLKLTGRELFITDVDDTTCKFSLKAHVEGEALELTPFGSMGEVSDFHGKHIARNVVVAEWYTPAIDLGTPAYAKTLDRIIVAMEPMKGGAASVGYETRMAMSEREAMTPKGFDLNELNFREFSLSAFAGSNTISCRERNVNYIRFRMTSTKPMDMRVDGITVEYKLTIANRGFV